MDTELSKIVERLTGELQRWLDQPGATAKNIEELKQRVSDLRSQLGATFLGDTLKQLEKADAEARRARQREAAEAIAEGCRGLGVVLAAKEPPRRKPRKRKPMAGDQPPATPPQTSPQASDNLATLSGGGAALFSLPPRSCKRIIRGSSSTP